MEEKISIALPPTWTDRDVTIEFDQLRPEVICQLLLIGLRTRVFDKLTDMPRNGRLEGKWVADAINVVFAETQRPVAFEAEADDIVTTSILRFVEATAIYDVTDRLASLDLLTVPSITRQRLIFDGIRCFPAKDLPDRLLADHLILPGEEEESEN